MNTIYIFVQNQTPIMKSLFFRISFLFLLTKINAQQDFILYHMPSIPQITQVDPASMPDSKLDIGLPIISSVYGSVFNTGFSIGDIFYQNADGIMMPDVDNAIAKMSSENFFQKRFVVGQMPIS